jgi:hypothetical protein
VINNRVWLRSGVARLCLHAARRDHRTLLRRGARPRRHAPDLAARAGDHPQAPLIHVAGDGLGLIMRLLTGAGTFREIWARVSAGVAVGVISNAALCC